MKLKQDITLSEYIDTWKEGGRFTDENGEVKEIEMKDALTHANFTTFFPQTVETIVREAIEPVMVGSSLLDRVEYKNGITTGGFSIGAITAEDVAETGEYPEYAINFGSGTSITTIGKSGLALKFSEELIRYSQFDIINHTFRAAGKALIRHKESKIWSMISRLGVTTHDNITPASSVYGRTTGYDYDGTGNGSVTAEDIIEAYGQVIKNGFTPDTLIVHPMTYTMFLTDPVLRAFAMANGGGQWFNGYNGDAKTIYPWTKGALGKAGPGLAKETSASKPIDLLNNATMKLPNYLGLPLQVLVSPFVPYNHVTQVTDIMMVDSSNIGALIVDEEVIVDEIPDKYRDILKFKLRERYSLQPYHEGNACAVIKNVKVTPNRILAPIQATLTDFTPVVRK